MKRKITPIRYASLRIVNMGRGCIDCGCLDLEGECQEEREVVFGGGGGGDGGGTAPAREAVHAECRVLRESIVREGE